MSPLRSLFVSLCSFSAVCSFSYGHNNYFLPGDAFFSISINAKQAETLKDEKETEYVFDYQRLDASFMACGNLGYSSLKMTGWTPEFRAAFQLAYERVRDQELVKYVKVNNDGKEEFVEWNPVSALIYNKGKVPHPIGLKFNEDWKTQGLGVYGGFSASGSAILADWSSAEAVPPLKLSKKLDPKLHLAAGGDVHKTVRTPVEIDAKDVEVVFIGTVKTQSWVISSCENLSAIADEEDYFYYKVTNEGVTLVECYSWQGGEEKVFKVTKEGLTEVKNK